MTKAISSWPSKKAQRIITTVSFIILSFVFFLSYIMLLPTNSQLRAKTETKNIKEVVRGIHQVYANKANYQDLNNTILIQAQAVPSIMIEGQDLINSVGGKVIIENATAEINHTPKLYKLSYYDFPQIDCQNIVESTYDDFIQIKVNDKIIKPANQKNKVKDFNSLLKQACQADSNTLIFYGN